jgi:subtilisin family serine protease
MFDAVGSGPSRPEPHGTEIAGILAARGQLTGVAPEAKLLSVRTFTGGKTKPAQSTSLQLMKGIDWAYEAGARIMNMSFTGPMDPLLERMIKAASEKGVILIAAAGNDGPKAPPVYPAAYPDVIAVTATDDTDKPYARPIGVITSHSPRPAWTLSFPRSKVGTTLPLGLRWPRPMSRVSWHF